MDNYKEIADYLMGFLKERVEKSGLNKVVLGLSGGIDSAVVAVLAQKVFRDNLLCVMMPSQYSSASSLDDAIELCKKFNIKYEIVSIKPLLEAFEREDSTKLRVGNASARFRMVVLYDISARDSSLVLGTSNKSELLLGYTTMYGDNAYAINPIGDLYKTEIFELARYLGVTEAIINKPPSGDLWEGQSDEEEIGFSYSDIDSVLKLYIDEQKNEKDLLKYGKSKQLIDMITYMIEKNRFKRELPIIASMASFRKTTQEGSI